MDPLTARRVEDGRRRLNTFQRAEKTPWPSSWTDWRPAMKQLREKAAQRFAAATKEKNN